MFTYCRQFSQSLTGMSILLLSSFFKKLKRHRTIYLHNDVIGFGTFIRITEIGSNLGVNLIPQFRIPFGMFIFGTSRWGETQDDSTSENYCSVQRRTCPDRPWRILEILPSPRTKPWLGSGLLGNKGEFSQQCWRPTGEKPDKTPLSWGNLYAFHRMDAPTD